MTSPQRTALMSRWWPAACRTQGWDRNDRELRLRVLSEAVNRPLTSASELDTKRDIDAVIAHLGRLAEDVGKTIEHGNPAPGQRRRYLWLIRRAAETLGGDAYLLALARDRFHITVGLNCIEDLDTTRLWQLMITLTHRRRSQDAATAAPVLEPADDPGAELGLPEVPAEAELAECPF